MVSRWQENELMAALKTFRVVNLTGARQCGKTTLAEMAPISSAKRYTLDDDETRKAAIGDPHGFVDRHNGETLVIDEIQKVPELLNAIKMKVDKNHAKGQYLLTGSSNLRFVKAVSDSLAGRIGRVRLRTFSLGELYGGKGDFLKRAFRRDFPTDIPHLGKRDVISIATRSGYPEPMELDEHRRMKWFRSYLDDLIVKDIRDVTEIRKLDVLRKVAEWLLAYSSKFFEVTELAAKVGVGKETVDGYIAALKALYLFDEIRPWTNSDYSKIGRRCKFFASDIGLATNILGWTDESIYMNDDRSRKVVETWVCQNLATLVDLNPDCELWQYRDSNKREIDFVVERSDGAILGIEVKSGSSLGADDFKHLKWFAKNLAKGSFTGIVLYAGQNLLRFGEGFYAVPFAALAC
ncbi:MAG: ATP-binding protein [Kiritimatiellae bacterium]|nr:ATP-binding protein [Kiritimatiellia bacterium]